MSEPICTLRIPLRVVTETNMREHHFVRAKRAKEQRAVTRLVLQSAMAKPPAPPLVVTLTRIIGLRGRPFDAFENLPASMKHVVDEIAAWLGVNDRSPLVRYVATQVRSKDGSWGVGVSIARASPDTTAGCSASP